MIGVEGYAGHVKYIEETFDANGIGPEVGKAIYGVVGATEGDTLFPEANDPSRVYGGVAGFSDAERSEGLFASVIPLISAKVKRVVVGTHSFDIDRRLASLFAKDDCELEGLNSCVMREDGTQPVILRDGVQALKKRSFLSFRRRRSSDFRFEPPAIANCSPVWKLITSSKSAWLRLIVFIL